MFVILHRMCVPHIVMVDMVSTLETVDMVNIGATPPPKKIFKKEVKILKDLF
jgi:hypothetical protein